MNKNSIYNENQKITTLPIRRNKFSLREIRKLTKNNRNIVIIPKVFDVCNKFILDIILLIF